MKKLIAILICIIYHTAEAQSVPSGPTQKDLGCTCKKFKEYSLKLQPFPLAIVDCDNVRSLLAYGNDKWEFVPFERSTIIKDGIYVDSTDANALIVKVRDLFFEKFMTVKLWKDKNSGKLTKLGVMD